MLLDQLTADRFNPNSYLSSVPKHGALCIEELPSLLGKSDPVVLEIGANDGEDTRRWLNAFPGINIYCFEPDSRALVEFRKNIDLEDPRVHLITAAVADFDGRAKWWASGWAKTVDPSKRSVADWHKSSSILKPTGHLRKHPEIAFHQDGEVDVIKLDSWYKQSGVTQIDFIFADVQGAEAKLILGGRRALANTRYFYTEFSDQPLYAGQRDLRMLWQLLPGRWELLGIYDKENALFRQCTEKAG